MHQYKFYSPYSSSLPVDFLKIIQENVSQALVGYHRDRLSGIFTFKSYDFIDNIKDHYSIKTFSLSSIRQKRNSLLASSDWTQFSDTPLSQQDRDDWLIYRKLLRDITIGLSENSKWPNPPKSNSEEESIEIVDIELILLSHTEQDNIIEIIE